MIPKDFLYFSLNLTQESVNYLFNYLHINKSIVDNLKDKQITGEYFHHCTLFHINSKRPFDEKLRYYLYSLIKKRFEEDKEKVCKIKIIGYGISNRALAFKVDSNTLSFPKIENHIYHITAYTFNGAKPFESNNITDWYDFDKPIEVECVLVENLKD